MTPRSLIFSFFLFVSLMLSGCVQTDIQKPFREKFAFNPWDRSQNIDTASLEENLTETELRIMEQSQDDKIARIPFPQEEYKYLARSGTGTIKGKIFISDYDGNVMALGKGTRLYLNPVTSYSDQWYNDSYMGGQKMQKPDSRLFNYLKFTSSDNQGRFAFYGIPAGAYYLIGTVQCAHKCGFESTKSVRLATKVEVQDMEVKENDLTRILER